MQVEGLEYADEIGLSSRNRSILNELSSGMSSPAAARKYGLSAAGVRWIATAYRSHVSDYLTWRDKIREENLLSGRFFNSRSPLTQAVVRAYASGSSYAETAQEYGISAEKVMQVISIFMADVARPRDRAGNLISSQRQKAVGKRLRELRLAKGLTISQVAHELGVSRRTVERYEYGESELKNSKLMWIAELCDVTVDYILAVE